MATNQRTIRKERAVQGKSLHTGEEVTLTLKPAAPNTGFVFRRNDLYGKPEIRPLSENISDLVRSTTITNGNAKVHTIEHVLSALTGCGIDNAEIELDASEPPIMDGSSRPFVNLIMEAEPIDQEEERGLLKLPSLSQLLRAIVQSLPYLMTDSVLPVPPQMTGVSMCNTFPLISIRKLMSPRLLRPELLRSMRRLKSFSRSGKFRGEVSIVPS